MSEEELQILEGIDPDEGHVTEEVRTLFYMHILVDCTLPLPKYTSINSLARSCVHFCSFAETCGWTGRDC